MSRSPLNDEKIVDSWVKNANPWVTAIREGQIESRLACTDDAIVDAVTSRSPGSALDLGCGEGWLTRKLEDRGIDMIGVDVIPELIEEAARIRSGDYRVASYEDIAAGSLDVKVDAIVCNFSLLGKESVEGVVHAARSLLNQGGSFIVQTPHPVYASGDGPYEDGWRQGSWDGFADAFKDPAPWYFRTVGGWINLFVSNGYQLREVREPVHPDTGKPASVILIAGRHP